MPLKFDEFLRFDNSRNGLRLGNVICANSEFEFLGSIKTMGRAKDAKCSVIEMQKVTAEVLEGVEALLKRGLSYRPALGCIKRDSGN
ncbi:hypothetical protein R1flu_020360 [Riccia fluitans]|uniref:Uncharacterized protein n=1 Tax=Riccia fluitans TaxID=41844 RepID=A0ABD1ZLA2_9MARC